jgi:hypothetical protein
MMDVTARSRFNLPALEVALSFLSAYAGDIRSRLKIAVRDNERQIDWTRLTVIQKPPCA